MWVPAGARQRRTGGPVATVALNLPCLARCPKQRRQSPQPSNCPANGLRCLHVGALAGWAAIGVPGRRGLPSCSSRRDSCAASQHRESSFHRHRATDRQERLAAGSRDRQQTADSRQQRQTAQTTADADGRQTGVRILFAPVCHLPRP